MLSLPRIPDAQDQAGPLYPWDHWATVSTGPRRVRWYRGYWVTGSTVGLWALGHRDHWKHCTPQNYGGLMAQADWATAVLFSQRSATALTPDSLKLTEFDLAGSG